MQLTTGAYQQSADQSEALAALLSLSTTPFTPMRLFGPLARIQLRMSATFIRAALAGPTAAAALTGSASLLFSTVMADDKKSLALGLKRRDPELLDRLIEQYQYRLFRYLLYLTGHRERAEDFFQETWIRVLERGHQYDGKSKFEAWLFSI